MKPAPPVTRSFCIKPAYRLVIFRSSRGVDIPAAPIVPVVTGSTIGYSLPTYGGDLDLCPDPSGVMVKTIKTHKLRTGAALCLPFALALTWATPATAAPAPSPSPAATTKSPAPTGSAATPKATATATASPAAPKQASTPASAPSSTQSSAPATATAPSSPSAKAQAAAAAEPPLEQGQARMGRAGLNPATTSAAMAKTQQVPVAQATEPWVAEQP